MKALIKVGYSCNDHCSFCHTQDVRHIDGSESEVFRKIARAKQLGHRMVVLSGGEPTIRPELVRWAARVSESGMDFGLVTNGRMLSYPKLVDQLMRHRLAYVYLSLHGGSPRVHNRLVRTDAFDQSFGAIEVLSGRGLDLTVNCVVTRHNMAHLKELVDAVISYDDVSLKFSMVEPKGGAEHLFEHLMPPVNEAAARVVEALDYGYEKAGKGASTSFRPRLVHGAFPLCLVPGHAHLYDDLKTHRYWTMVEIGEGDFYPVDDRNKIQPEGLCDDCALRGPCPGLYVGYHRSRGASELKPLRSGTRSNSYNYRLERALRVDPAQACPLKEGSLGVTPWDVGRHLLVRRGERLAIYYAASRDFSDAEVNHVKHDVGQVYLDISQKDAPDDFAADLRKVNRAGVCAGCDQVDGCTGLFEVMDQDVFGRDDARVREIVRGLRGRVLDLGCGEFPYGEEIAERVAAGEVQYVGVDPHEPHIHMLRERFPQMEFRHQRAEDVVLDQESFDHVLLLRSWNHLEDVRVVGERFVPALRPGGTLTIVDNTVFGLARSFRQSARGESSSAQREHHRNDTASQAALRIDDPRLVNIMTNEVEPATSNQWILRYSRCAGDEEDR